MRKSASGVKSGTRKLVVLAAAAVAAFVGFSWSETASAQGGVAGRVYSAISLHNAGQVARQFDVNIFQKRARNNRERLVESVTVWVAAGGDFHWNRAVVGKTYRLQVTNQPSGEIALDTTTEVKTDGTGGDVPVSIDAEPGQEDPRDAQIATLQQDLAAEPGSQIDLSDVLLVADGEQVTVGQPTVPGARVVAEVLGERKGKKIIVFKYKAKVRYRRKTGHRQWISRLLVRDIVTG